MLDNGSCRGGILDRSDSKPDALLILANGRNSANRITLPSLRRLCETGAKLLRPKSVCAVFDSSLNMSVKIQFDFNFTCERNAFFRVDTPKQDCVAVTLSPCDTVENNMTIRAVITGT